MFERKKTAREIFPYELFRFDEWKKWESTTKEFRSLKEIEEDAEKDSDNADKDVEDVLEFINKNKTANEKDVKDQQIPDEEEQSNENLIKVTVNKLHKIFPKKTEQELKDEVQKRLKAKMTGDRKASRIFSDELLKDDEKEKWSNIEDDDTRQLDDQISKEVTKKVLWDLDMEKSTHVMGPPGMSQEEWARMNADRDKLKADLYKQLQTPPPLPENWQEILQTRKWGNI